MQQAEFERHVGAENICPSIAEALDRAAEVYKQNHATPAVAAAREEGKERVVKV
jgi:hypothetical protein